MAEQLEEIKRKIDIVQFINGYVPLKKTGRNFKALCPFHSETIPSFIVSPERQIWHCFGACLPSGSLIKTEKGYHPIEKVKVGQKVLTHKGRFRPVIRTLWRAYGGDIVDIRVRKSSEIVSLTTNHEIYVIRTRNCKQEGRKTRICQQHCRQNCPTKYFQDYKIEKIPAGEISLNDYLLFPINRNIKDVKFINLNDYLSRFISSHARRLKRLPKSIKVDKKFLQLVGYWIAEGSTDKWGHIVFSLGNHEKNFIDDIVNLVNRIFNLKSTIRQKTIEKNNSSGLEVIINSSNLANIFENLYGSGAVNKHIPFKFQNLPLEKQRIILEAIFRGDGTTGRVAKTNRLFKAISTVSPILAEQLRDILLRLGIIPTVTVKEARIDKKMVSHKKSYVISWQENIKLHFADIWVKDGVSYALFPVKEIKRRKLEDKVYNLTVDEDHSYVTKNFMVANCNEGGDIFKFLMKIENLEFGEALRELAKRAGVRLTRFKPSESEKQKQLLYEINHLAAEFYHYLLLNHSVGRQALRYILGRGISKPSLQLFKLGFAPNTWESLQKFLVGKKGYNPQDLEKAGLVIPTSNLKPQASKFYDRFRSRLIFPLKDHRGNICGFAGRVLDPEVKEAKYINTPETLIYHKSDLLYGLFETHQEIKGVDGVVLVEGELDAISSFQTGVKNVVAIKGSALTPNQVQLLGRFTKNISLALDRDIAGDQAARRGIEVADSGGMAIKVIELEGGKDPDEVAQKDPNLWRKLVAQSVPVYDYFLNSAFSRFDSKTAEGKRKIGQELIPILSRIADKIVQAHYIQALAERLGVDKEAVVAQIEKLRSEEEQEAGGERPVFAEVSAGEGKTRREIVEEYLLALCFQSGKWNNLQKREVLSLVMTPRFAGILGILGNYIKKYKGRKIPSESRPKGWESERLAKMLPAELVEVFNQLYLLSFGDLVTDEEKFEREFQKTINILREINLREKLKEISQKIRQLEAMEKPSKQDKKKLKILGQEFRDLTTHLVKTEV